MARRGSLPWLILAAVILTGFGVYLDATVLKPFADGIMQTSAWQNPGTSYAKQGMGMIGTFVKNITLIIILGIWTGVFLVARWAA